MLWRDRRRSANIEDRRDESPGGIGGPGGFGMSSGMRRGGIGGGIGLVLLVVLGLVFGVDPSILLDGGSSGPSSSYVPQSGSPGPVPQAEREAGDFVAVVLADTEDAWKEIFAREGGRYVEPKLVLFRGAVQSACGYAQAAMGPFYCPRDQKVYIDLSFFDDLKQRFGAPGDFAQAYVLAHEIGHHVQNLLGIAPKVEAAQRQAGRADANQLSVMLELQADCFAGVWARRAQAKGVLEAGDIEEGMNAAAAVGDDRIQRRSQGYVVPDAFTHGSSEQRARWFRKGFSSGDWQVCDTFGAAGR